MALRIPSVDPDGVLYISLAKALESGDLHQATQGMGLNTYPVILMGLHRAGMDWEMAGVVWGVVIASLVVLPLFGWVRRQFDDRVALAACLLYAVHPQMIQWSPEIARDSTFWFILMLSLYLIWRAVTEVRALWFALAGIAVVLAILTRFEGLILLIPLGLWSLWRLRGLKQARRRLVLGVVLCVATVPLLALLLGLAGLSEPLSGLHVRLDPWARFQTWLSYMTGQATGQGSLNPLLPAGEAPVSLARMARMFFPVMTRGLSPVYALLMFGGIWAWRHVWARRDHQASFYAACGVLAGIWVHLWYDRAICPRYALTIVLLASPFAALGLLGAVRRTVEVAERAGANARAQALAALLPLALIAAVGVAVAMTANRPYFATRKLAVELGRWLQASPWPAPTLVGPAGMTPIVSFYAQKGRYEIFRLDTGDESIIRGMVEQHRPEVLLLRPTKRMDAERCSQLVAQMKTRGFAQVDPVPRPERSDSLAVLVRGPARPNVPLVAGR